MADVVRSWIAANWNSKITMISAVATATGIALVVWLKSDRARIYAGCVTRIMLDYDRLMTKRKRQLFSELESLKDVRAHGRLVILEIGCGSGSNFRYYPAGSEVICVEPNRHFEAALYASARQQPEVKIAAFLVSSAERMREVESGSVDAVVSTLVLCSVDNLGQCLKEIIRVLKPGGKLFIMEHVKAPRQFYIVRFIQVLLSLVWPLIYDGCHLTRSTQDDIRKAGFSSVDIEEFEAHEIAEMGVHHRLVRSHISGTASK